MAAREWWDAVKHEVRDLLAPARSRRMATPPSGDSPALDAVRRQADVLSTTIYPPSLTAPGSSVSIETNIVLAPTSTATPTTTTQLVVASTTASAVRPSATAESSESDSGEMSVAAKAGIVIGVLGGILIVGLLVYLMVSARRKKLERRRQQIDDDEKSNGPFADSAAIKPLPTTPNKAPRLSLRPVTQFLPNFHSQSQAERRASRGIALTLNPVSHQPQNRPNGGSAWERPTARSTTTGPNGGDQRAGTSMSLHPHNPFHDKNELSEEPVSPVSSMGSFDHRVDAVRTADPIPEPVSPILGDDDDDDDHYRRQQQHRQPGPVSSLTRKASMRKDIPKPLDLTKPPSPLFAVPPSPAGTEYSMHLMAPGQNPGPSASAAEIAAAGGPTQSTVHRVQLDFKPTLQDEMELRPGQLVRLLHEYDDGWALCIRLDRSQQGVVPRTCLSTRPVKPRPQPGGGGGNGPHGGLGNPRGGPPVNPSFHHYNNSQQQQQTQRQHGRNGSGLRPSSPGGGGFPPVSVPGAKAGRWGGGGGGNGVGGGGGARPRSPNGGGDGGSGMGTWWRDSVKEGAAFGNGGPAPGQAY
ncbi:hypothetical protein N658DRAFT_159210 [Parathielavia hyrcaniae]|uniref:SH3 domain-containing protein n=1 Tax=Parathielavia hyrcaniae TaxID=113614 RepID=A0AAN6PXD6_9PEZI|nr:hypothetical protein N658DRAFT_159210 [Parathielavia hyrcaniae]